MVSSTELSQLKKLRQDLEAIEAVNSSIEAKEPQIEKYREECLKQIPKPVRLSTDNAETYKKSCMKSKNKTAGILRGVMVVLVIVAVIGLIALYMSKYILAEDGYLYTPEIVDQYTGQYYHDIHWDEAEGLQDHVFTITSCDADGKLWGKFECFLDGECLGSYNFSGRIDGKSEDGYLEATIYREGWIVEPYYEDYLPEEISSIVICDDFTTVKVISSFDGSPCQVYSSAELETNLETPEIIRSYSGEYGTYEFSHDDSVGTTTITSCDPDGYVTGYFEFYDNGNYGKYSLDGYITEKHANGIVYLTLSAGEWIEQPGYYSPLEDMSMVIFDDYSSLSCYQYWMEWSDDVTVGHLGIESETDVDSETEEEPVLLKKRPLTEEERALKKLMLILIVATPIIGFILLVILKRVLKLNCLNKEELQQFNSMQELDQKNYQENKSYDARVKKRNDEAFEKTWKYRQEILADLTQTLKGLESEVRENDVLGSKDKKLDVVNYVIDILESRRADSIKEALNKYDEWVKKHDQEILDYYNRKWDEYDRKLKAQQEAEDYMNQAFHRMKLQREAEKQTDELKRIRKELER